MVRSVGSVKKRPVVLQPGCHGKTRRQPLARFRREGAFHVVVDFARLLVDHGVLGRVVDVQLLVLRRLPQACLADLVGMVWLDAEGER